MHEMSLCEGIVQLLEQEAARQSFHKVNRVRLEVGALAGVEIAALRFGFDVVTRGTLADGAELDIFEQPALAWCLRCMQLVSVQQRYDPCPECGGYQLQVTQGESLKVKDLEVE